MSEINRIEYKQELSRDLDIEKEVIAFLNYNEGGYIFIGIDKKGKVLGVNDLDGDMLKLKDRIKNNILRSCMGLFDVQAIEREGKYIKVMTGNALRFQRIFKDDLPCTKICCPPRISPKLPPKLKVLFLTYQDK